MADPLEQLAQAYEAEYVASNHTICNNEPH